MKRIAFLILTAGLLAFSLAAETYKFEVTKKVLVGQTQLKPGSYAVDVDGAKALLKDRQGNTIAVTAKVEQLDSKAKTTLLGVSRDGGAEKLQSISFGGTTVRVTFE